MVFGLVKKTGRRNKNAQNEDGSTKDSSAQVTAFRKHILQAQKSADSERVRESFKKIPPGFKF